MSNYSYFRKNRHFEK